MKSKGLPNSDRPAHKRNRPDSVPKHAEKKAPGKR